MLHAEILGSEVPKCLTFLIFSKNFKTIDSLEFFLTYK